MVFWKLLAASPQPPAPACFSNRMLAVAWHTEAPSKDHVPASLEARQGPASGWELELSWATKGGT